MYRWSCSLIELLWLLLLLLLLFIVVVAGLIESVRECVTKCPPDRVVSDDHQRCVPCDGTCEGEGAVI